MDDNEHPTRPDWDTYYLGIAEAVSRRGDCLRRRVGAVVVSGTSIVSTGYNGSYSGGPSCLSQECPRGVLGDSIQPGQGYESTGCIAVHAEANAIIRGGRDRTLGATIYITADPCNQCLPLIRAAGITRVVTPFNIYDFNE